MGKVVTNWFSQIDAMIPMAGMTGALLTGNGVTLDTVAFWTMAIWVYNQISAYVRQYYSYFFMNTLTINGTSESYQWMLTYLNTTLLEKEGHVDEKDGNDGTDDDDIMDVKEKRMLPQVKQTPLAIRNFEVVVERRTKTPQRNNYNSAWNASTKTVPQVSFKPGLGTTLLVWKGHNILVSHEDAPQGSGMSNAGGGVDLSAGRRQLKLQSFRWPWTSRNILVELMKEVVEAHFMNQKDVTSIYTLNGMYGEIWGKLATRQKRPLSSVILPDGMAEMILEDAQRFLTSGQWYRERNLNRRRGYLLCGTPGTGKSSLITSLAAELGMDVCLIHLSTDNLNDTMLLQRLNLAPRRALVVLEDIDAAFPKRKLDGDSSDDEDEDENKNAPYRHSRLTLSGLLNALDGIAAQEGRIVVMTTNDAKSLDPALVRSGRVDMTIEFTPADHSQARRMFLRFFADEDDLAVEFADECMKGCEPAPGLVMADLQEVLVRAKDDASAALPELKSFMADKAQKAERVAAKEARRKARAKANLKKRLAAKALANRDLDKAVAAMEKEEKEEAKKEAEKEQKKEDEKKEDEKKEDEKKEDEKKDEVKKEEAVPSPDADKENTAVPAASSGTKTPPTQDVSDDTVMISTTAN